MPSFDGFPADDVSLTPIPEPFFSEILPQIDDLGELKITLYFFWRMAQQEGKIRYLRYSDISADERLSDSMQAFGIDVKNSIYLAVERGTLLAAQLGEESGQENQIESYYFLNTPRGRAAVESIQNGIWNPAEDTYIPDDVLDKPPNIYRLYEENIGPLTPMIADALKEAEDTYSTQWIKDAIQIAVERNKRSWNYAEAILERWRREGRDARKQKLEDRGDSEEARRRYIKGEFSDFVEH
jgi:DnaD/phage-associated family protein